MPQPGDGLENASSKDRTSASYAPVRKGGAVSLQLPLTGQQTSLAVYRDVASQARTQGVADPKAWLRSDPKLPVLSRSRSPRASSPLNLTNRSYSGIFFIPVNLTNLTYALLTSAHLLTSACPTGGCLSPHYLAPHPSPATSGDLRGGGWGRVQQ
ncbi:hypothetical protein O3P69_017589 [Scylla paramamosain]|uniref:Uncharacterized protein n=1 Tax=Scylla paramamosain TaxID=85552 RepID=A0AAW0TXN4_SCYPA